MLVTNRSKDWTKVEVKTLDWRNLWRFYFNPEDSTKISGFQLNGENVRVYNFSDDWTKAEAVNLKEWQYLWRCSFDPNDNILWKFQLNGEDIIVTSISKYWTKAHVKTLDLKSLWLYLFDPKDNKKLWPLRPPPQTIASNLSKQLSDYGEKRYELKRNYK